MTTLDKLIYGRRSIRKYRAEMPPAAWIEAMVLAGGRAPSPFNSQPVRFIRIVSESTRNSLRLSMQEGRNRLLEMLTAKGSPKRLFNWVNAYYHFSEFMYQAPVLFAFGADRNVINIAERLYRAGLESNSPGRSSDTDISIGLAAKGFILKGEDLGLGSCILTAPLLFIAEPEKVLGLEAVDIKCFVTAGYPDEKPDHLDRKAITDIYSER